ncbi:CYB561 [Cordylochernes scorpioides]|uniref:CYB561 n=1 Tax=Cordylochernes scorpioides TaxID=51811 RepID=A0ABY6K4U0_9ARAC|nr:CYB561 [Cordylochernes scorpioides]
MDLSPQHSAGPQDLKTFNYLLVASQILGAAAIVLSAVWTDKFLGGLGWYSSQDQQFNYHPLFMVLGMVLFYGESILVYRVLRKEPKFRLKLVHAVLHGVALVLTLVGLIAVFLSKQGRYTHLYSLHSWLGLGTCIAFFLQCTSFTRIVQYVISFLIFMFPGASPRRREKFLALHTFFGLLLFAFAVGSCIVGINEKVSL